MFVDAIGIGNKRAAAVSGTSALRQTVRAAELRLWPIREIYSALDPRDTPWEGRLGIF
jgi:hypothetical protein